MTDNRSAPPPQAPAPPAAQPPAGPPPWYPPPRKKSVAKRILTGIFILLFVLSILVNAELLILLSADSGKLFRGEILRDGAEDQTVAVYRVTGTIDGEAALLFEAFVHDVARDAKVKAVVIRVDSGGGGVAASDEIAHAIRTIREDLKKPVVISMGSVAASGGYYIAVGANEIYAEPTTVTGSIGVIAVWPVMEGALDKLGIQMVTIRSTRAELWKAKENPWETPSQRIVQNVRDMLNTMQARFEQVVQDGRGGRIKVRTRTVQVPGPDGQLTEVEETVPFNGEVYLADEALKIGLIDAVGYQRDAEVVAARLAGLDKPRIVLYRKARGLLEKVLGGPEAQQMVVGVRIDEQLLDRLQTPRILMLWKVD